MRRTLVCLSAAPVAVSVVAILSLSFQTSDQSAAQDRVAEAPAATPGKVKDRYAVPDATEVAVLVDFVKLLKKLDPDEEKTQEEFDQKAAAAIRRACERILELDKNDQSQHRRFAHGELLSLALSELAEQPNPDKDTTAQIAKQIREFFQASGRTKDEADQATSLAGQFEEIATTADAKSLYQSLGELFAKNAEENVAQRGLFLLGAARRMGIEGQPFELTGTDLDGNSFELQSLKGKIVLVEFWASWCEHCLADFPRLKRDYQRFRSRGFEIVGISADDDLDDLKSCLKKQRLPWRILHDEKAGSEHPAVIHYGIGEFPTSFLIDREGRVVATDLRGRDLTAKLSELLGPDPKSETSYPVMNVHDVVGAVTKVAAKLHKQGKTKSDVELRKGLNRESVELDLPPAWEDEVSDRELYRRASESVFLVCSMYRIENTDEWETSLATAFAITKDGVLTTSCHVFDNEDKADAVVVMDVHQKVYAIKEILAANRGADTCLFRIDAKEVKPLPLASEALPGTRVRVLGHPGDSFYFFSTGSLANYERDSDGMTWLNITADFGQGSSGGPAMDENGNVVGQVSRTFTLYAGGAARSRPRRVQTEKAKRDESDDGKSEGSDVADPQLVFKACVPVKTIRSLVKTKTPPPLPK